MEPETEFATRQPSVSLLYCVSCKPSVAFLRKSGRGGEIRTHDLLYPKQARYQATLRPEPEAESVPPLVLLCNM